MPGDAPTEEELRNMSPEELAELQRKNCIFCKLIAGEIPSQKVYDDKECVALLDINPASDGHILLLPRQHYQIMPQLPPKLVQHLAVITKALSHVLLKALGARGTEVFIANGAAAGQRAPHFMIHIFPRSEGDGLPQIPRAALSQQDLDQVKQLLQQKLGVAASSSRPQAQPAKSSRDAAPSADEDKEGAGPEQRLDRDEEEAETDGPADEQTTEQDDPVEGQDEQETQEDDTDEEQDVDNTEDDDQEDDLDTDEAGQARLSSQDLDDITRLFS